MYSHFWCIFGPFWGILGRNTPKPLRLGYFAWCIPKVTAPTRHVRPKLMPPVPSSLDLVLVANAPEEGLLGVGAGAARLLRLSLRQLCRCGVVRQWLPGPARGSPSPTRGVLGYFQWGISLPLGDLTCAAGGGVLWGISSGVFRCPAPGTTPHLHTAPLPY